MQPINSSRIQTLKTSRHEFAFTGIMTSQRVTFLTLPYLVIYLYSITKLLDFSTHRCQHGSSSKSSNNYKTFVVAIMSDRIGVVEVPNSFFAIILTGESVNGESLLLYKFIILFFNQSIFVLWKILWY